jgi:hypothetical protein
MPPLPDHFVERPDHQQAVKDRLLSDDPKVFGTLVVSAIHGLGGIGKSVLAAKLAHDEQVQARFGDGILWATLGQNPIFCRCSAAGFRPGGYGLQAHRHCRRLGPPAHPALCQAGAAGGG